MSYYALLAPAYTGHLNPMTTLARALQRRGHRVAIIAPLDAEAKVRVRGLDFIPIAAAEFPRGEWERLAAGLGERTGFAASRFVCRWLALFARGIQRELPELAAKAGFDGLVMDQICIGAEGACQVAGLPLAVACSALALHAEPDIPPSMVCWPYEPGWIARVRNLAGFIICNSNGWPVYIECMKFRRRHGLPRMALYHVNEMTPSLVQVAQQPACFDFPRARLPEHFHYTGPWLEEHAEPEPAFPWERLDGRPLIYASLGTLQNRLESAYRIIAEACAGLDAQLVVALGRPGAVQGDPLPGNPIVAGYAPQLALLRRASLVITHGGLNTTLESLREGLPLVALPIANDQPGIAARIRHLGVGDFIPIQRVTAGGLRAVLERVLASAAHRHQAMQFSAMIRAVNGQDRAATLIEAAFTRRQRISRHDAEWTAPSTA